MNQRKDLPRVAVTSNVACSTQQAGEMRRGRGSSRWRVWPPQLARWWQVLCLVVFLQVVLPTSVMLLRDGSTRSAATSTTSCPHSIGPRRRREPGEVSAPT